MMKKTIITVTGRDTVGIIARVCTYLAEQKVNVEDISQTIIQGFFHMMLIADFNTSEMPFDQCQKELTQIGEEIGVEIRVQKEEIFGMMHRI